MTTTMPLSILERMLSDAKLEEITQENMEKDEKEREPKEDSVSSDKGMEKLPQETDRGKGSDLSVLRKKDKTTSVPSRGRKRRKIPESKP